MAVAIIPETTPDKILLKPRALNY